VLRNQSIAAVSAEGCAAWPLSVLRPAGLQMANMSLSWYKMFTPAKQQYRVLVSTCNL
jgi:hypothetical protein